MVGQILLPEIPGMIEARNFSALRELFSEMLPADVAEIILDLPEEAIAKAVVLAADDRRALLEGLPSAAAHQLIRLLTLEERRIAQALLGYPGGQRRALMTPDLISVYPSWTVGEVLAYIREHGQNSETLIALNVTDSQQDAVNVFRKYDRSALPVADSNGVLVGLVTIDEMLDVAEEVLPMIISSGGDSGSQASMLIIRATALGEGTLPDWWRVMRKEIVAGLML